MKSIDAQRDAVRTRLRLRIGLLVAATASALVLLSGLAGQLRDVAATRQPASGGEARVVKASIEDVFLLSGELRALRSVGIAVPRTEDWEIQIRWLAEDGSEVREGERVAEFDSTRTLTAIEERRTKLRQAEIERESRERTQQAELEAKRMAVLKAEVETELAQVDAEIPRELRSSLDWRKSQGALLEKRTSLDKARLELESYRIAARADLEVMRLAEQKARRELASAEMTLSSVSVRAPRSGIFIVADHWNRSEGRKLQPGDNLFRGLPVASIPDLTEMEVAATLSEVDYGRIAAGSAARIVLDTYADRVFEGRVEDVGAVAAEGREDTGFPVRVSLASTDPAIMLPGMSVRVEVVRGVWRDVLSLPRAAVRFEGEQVLVRRAGDARPTPVSLKGCTPLLCALGSGLVEGERVRPF